MKTKDKTNDKKIKTITTEKDALKEISAQSGAIIRLLQPGSLGELSNGKFSAATWRKVEKAREQIDKLIKTFGPRHCSLGNH